MRKVILPMLLLSWPLWAQDFLYKLEITPEKYKLTMRMSFHETLFLQDVIKGFKNGKLLSGVSDSIKSAQYEPPMSERYIQTLKVKSWGISSTLVSNCKENFENETWMRECQLLTDQKDGGKYMVWKKDMIQCSKKLGHVECEADIQGASKPIVFLGITLASPQKFALRAKIPALYNFSQQWWAINHATLDFEFIQKNFQQSELKTKIDLMLDEGLKALNSQQSFQFSEEYKEPQG